MTDNQGLAEIVRLFSVICFLGAVLTVGCACYVRRVGQRWRKRHYDFARDDAWPPLPFDLPPAPRPPRRKENSE